MAPVHTKYDHHEYKSYAQQRNAQRPSVERQMLQGEAAIYGNRQRYTQKQAKKPISKVTIAIAAVAAVAIGVGIWMFLNPARYDITVNGNRLNVERGTTMGDLIELGAADPIAGNLFAIDGSLITAEGGDVFSGTINGQSTNDINATVGKDDVVYIDDGADVTEDYTSEIKDVAPGEASGGIGALHVYLTGESGQTEYKTGAISGITVEEVIKPVVNSGYVQYNANTGDEKVIALTFDDGPWDTTTEQILDILKQNDAKATFFTIGNQVSSHADVVKRAASEGHQICTHSWDHAEGSGQGVNMTYMSTQEQINEVVKGQQAVQEATGSEASKVFRSPGGNFYGDIIWTLQPYITAEINWNIDTEDWRRPGVDHIVSQIESAKSGDVVLMHDGGGDRSQTVEALRQALPYLKAQGYRFVTIDELISLTDPSTIKI